MINHQGQDEKDDLRVQNGRDYCLLCHHGLQAKRFDGKGRGVIATSSLATGEALLSELPVTVVGDSDAEALEELCKLVVDGESRFSHLCELPHNIDGCKPQNATCRDLSLDKPVSSRVPHPFQQV